MINHLMVVHIQKHESRVNEKNIMPSNTFSIICSSKAQHHSYSS